MHSGLNALTRTILSSSINTLQFENNQLDIPTLPTSSVIVPGKKYFRCAGRVDLQLLGHGCDQATVNSALLCSVLDHVDNPQPAGLSVLLCYCLDHLIVPTVAKVCKSCPHCSRLVRH